MDRAARTRDEESLRSTSGCALQRACFERPPPTGMRTTYPCRVLMLGLRIAVAAQVELGEPDPMHDGTESRRLMAAVGAYARPLARRSRKAAAAIRRSDFRPRVLVVRTSTVLVAVQRMSSRLANSRCGNRRGTRCGSFPGRSVRAHGR